MIKRFSDYKSTNFLEKLKKAILSTQDSYRKVSNDPNVNFIDVIKQPNGYFKNKIDIYVLVVDKIINGQKPSQFMKKLTDQIHKTYGNVYVYMMSEKALKEDYKYFWGAHESAHCMAYKIGLRPDKPYYNDLPQCSPYPNSEEEHYTFKFQFQQMKKHNID